MSSVTVTQPQKSHDATLCNLPAKAVTSTPRFQGKEQRILEPYFPTAPAITIFRTVHGSLGLEGHVDAVFFAEMLACVSGTRFLLGEGVATDACEQKCLHVNTHVYV